MNSSRQERSLVEPPSKTDKDLKQAKITQILPKLNPEEAISAKDAKISDIDR